MRFIKKIFKYYQHIFIGYITGSISYITQLSEENSKLFVWCTWKIGHAPSRLLRKLFLVCSEHVEPRHATTKN